MVSLLECSGIIITSVLITVSIFFLILIVLFYFFSKGYLLHQSNENEDTLLRGRTFILGSAVLQKQQTEFTFTLRHIFLFQLYAVTCRAMSWTQGSLWIPSTLGYSIKLYALKWVYLSSASSLSDKHALKVFWQECPSARIYFIHFSAPSCYFFSYSDSTLFSFSHILL